MKTLIANLFLICSFIVMGCRKQEDPPIPNKVPRASESAGDLLVSAPNYLSQAGRAEQSMQKTIDITSINSAIQLFNVQEGRYPTDLNELVSAKYLGKLPSLPFGSKLEYNATDGKVLVVKQ